MTKKNKGYIIDEKLTIMIQLNCRQEWEQQFRDLKKRIIGRRILSAY